MVRLSELAGAIGAELRGDGDAEVGAAAGLAEAGPGDLAFYANPRYRAQLEATAATAVILDATTADALGEVAFACLVHPRPAAGHARALAILHPEPISAPGVDPRAVIEDGAEVDPTASVGAFVFVAAGARVGPRTVLHPQVYVGPDARIGADCQLQAGCVIREGCELGDRVRLQPRVVIGADGFGYAQDVGDDGRPLHRKIPQVGIVRIEDDVEIGAGSCIDRATTGATVIGHGTKIDNLVQVGHNVTIGPLSILCGQAGVAGSATLGAGVVLAGQAGVVGHADLADGVTVAAKSGTVGSVRKAGVYSGYPAMPHRAWLKAMAALRELPELVRRVRRLERRLDDEA